VGDRNILGKYLNSAYKNISETDIFPNGTKSLLTSDYWSFHILRKIINLLGTIFPILQAEINKSFGVEILQFVSLQV